MKPLSKLWTNEDSQWALWIVEFLFACFLVGAFMALVNIELIDVAVFILQSVRRVQDMGIMETVESIPELIILGMSVLIPILLIRKILTWGAGKFTKRKAAKKDNA